MHRIYRYSLAASLAGLTLLTSQQMVLAAEELPSPYPYPEPAWSPYLVGTLIGLLVLATLTIANKKIGASSAYSDLAGLIGRAVAPQHVRSLPYWREHTPQFGWTLMVVAGVILGSFLAAWTGGELNGEFLQPMWLARFGDDSSIARVIVALLGGACMAYGARMAGGCTSGHGISGTLQLAVSSWIALSCFFVGGIVTALLVYRF